jgi:SAM-dependent methyltransferase
VDILAYNRAAWDRLVENGNQWTRPVGPEVIAAARRGVWSVLLTPTRPVPREWFPPLPGCRVLCLASGGGQQGPVLAAAGADVTVFDNSPRQLAQDRLAAEREGLALAMVQGDMADLSAFPDASFDLIFHPVSNVFAPAVQPVWREAHRVLRPGGTLLAGFNNPAVYIFDWQRMEADGTLEVRYTLPYSDLDSLPPDKRDAYLAEGHPVEFSHSLEDQIGGQADAGLHIVGLYEDRYPPEAGDALSRYMPIFIATRALRPR